ncbi:hypothetical protein [Amycolatopsis lurida]|uniref:Bacterial transcriptional activator domain-containing protein n=1 Tax=Amycolatopsis lurida NRRL 2430 TaxID=1460371 RepID=A0A2P2FUF1_AMYLU|nr:hypothetical protein [Amycolatopsis lurida]KFU80346.1 hypothetical protein BB31_16105 [Amycolatopsis lurida NRRL 2430]
MKNSAWTPDRNSSPCTSRSRAHRGLARVASDPETVRDHCERAIALYGELGLPAAEHTEAELAKSSLS